MRRVMAIVAVIIALGAIGAMALALSVPPPPAPVEVAGATMHPVESLPRASVPEMVSTFPQSATELRAMLATRIRLAPDRRGLLALGELYRMQGNGAVVVEARWREGRWQVLAGAVPVGTLPEHADFDDLLTLASSLASALNPLHPLNSRAAPFADWPMLSPSHPPSERLSTLDAAWSSGWRSSAVVAAAARALVALAVETPDSIDAADGLAARALAAVAWARSLGQADVETEALLARHLHYDTAAVRLAAMLPDTSAVKHWVRRDDEALRRAATEGGGSETARYLWFRRLVEQRDAAEAARFTEEHFDDTRELVPVAGFSLIAWGQHPLERYRTVLHAQPARMLVALEREVHLDAPMVRASTDVLLRVAALSARYTSNGTFWDRELASTRARAIVLSALYDDLEFMLGAGASPSAATTLVEALGVSTPESFRDYVAWATHIVYARGGTLSPDVLLQDLAAPLALGPSAFVRTYESFVHLRPAGDLRGRLAFEHLAVHLDARPALRAHLAREGGALLHDLVLTEGECDRLIAVSRHAAPTVTAWCLDQRGDRAGLLGLATDRAFSEGARIYALELAGWRAGADTDAIDRAWRSLLAERSRSWFVVEGFAHYLDTRGRLDEALAVLASWRRAHRDEGAAFLGEASDRIADLLRRRGEAERALRTVERDLDMQRPETSIVVARSLADLGRFDDADRVARTALERHRNGASAALIAELAWRRNDIERAARALAQSGVVLRDEDWRVRVADAFVSSFGAAPEALGVRAFGALVSAALDPGHLVYLPRALARNARYDLAASTLATIDPSRIDVSDMGSLDLIAEEFLYRRAASGYERALEWLRRRLTITQRTQFALAAHVVGIPSLLDDFCEPTGTDEDIELLWLLRACALGMPGSTGSRARVEAHYREAHTSVYADLGRFVLGQIDLRAMVAAARIPKRRTELAYFAAVRARAAGRVDEASDWYQLTTLVAADDDREGRWARRALTELYDRHESLASLNAAPWGRVRPTVASAPVAEVMEPGDEATTVTTTRGRRHRRDRARDGRRHERHRR